MKILKASEAIVVSQIKAQIFGAPGSGKTSFALSAEAPLLLDFDMGAHRAIRRADTMVINDWTDVMGLLTSKDDLAGYKTIVCDTVGKQLDMLGRHIISENGRLATTGGALTQQGYGVRKAHYYSFLQNVLALGLDIVLVSHDREKDVDEVTKVRPDVSGSTYSDIMKEMDLCGYMEIVKGKRMIDFNPSERSIGKNCAGFPQMEVTDNLTMASLISETKKIINKRNEASADIIAEIDQWKAKIAEIKTGEDAMKVVSDVKTVESDTIKQQVRKLLADKTTSLGLKYDATAKSYVPVNAA